MRIGLFIDTFNLGGAEVMVFELANLLHSAGHTPILLHFGSDYVINHAKQHGMEQYQIPFRHHYKKTVQLPLFALKVRPFLKSLKLDCLHSHLYGPCVAMSMACVGSRIKSVGTLHDIYTIEERPARIQLLKIATWLGTQVIVVSTQMYKFYIDHGINSKHLQHIPNFAPELPALRDPIALKTSLGLSPQQKIVLSVGRLVALKGFNRVIDAARQLPPACTILIVGDGPERQQLAQTIADQKLSDRVLLLGERHDVQNLLQIADVFVLASDTEGLSRSILEALSAGLPVVATRVGGNHDLVENEQNGYLVPLDHIEQLGQRVAAILTDDSLRQKLGNNSKNKARQQFSVDAFLSQHLLSYRH